MKYPLYILFFLLAVQASFAQPAGNFGGSRGPKIVITPPPEYAKAVDPCKTGQCGFGKKQKKNRKGFGNKRKKSISSFGKGLKSNRKSKSIVSGSRSKSRRYKR